MKTLSMVLCREGKKIFESLWPKIFEFSKFVEMLHKLLCGPRRGKDNTNIN